MLFIKLLVRYRNQTLLWQPHRMLLLLISGTSSLTARKEAEREGVEIRLYSIIYDAIEDKICYGRYAFTRYQRRSNR